MHEHASRRPIPVEQSIHWKPLNDSHYVVASLQPADGGRRKIFIRQQVVGRVEALVRAHGRRTFGLLLGQFYHCPVTGADYYVIEAIAEQSPVGDEAEIAAALGEALEARTGKHHTHVVGWYRGVPTVDAKPSPVTAGIHTSLFRQPWQTALVVAEAAHGPGGAFYLRDGVNSRWFSAPFYELPDHAAAPGQPKPTLVNWPQYLTTDAVMPASREPMPPTEVAEVREKKPYERPGLSRLFGKSNGAPPEPSVDLTDIPLVPSPSATPRTTSTPAPALPPMTREAIEPAVAKPAAASEPPSVDARPLTDRPGVQPVRRGLADAPRARREGRTTHRGDSSFEKLSIVDDQDQRTAGPGNGRRVGDDDDTSTSDDPARYIEIARAEGFFVAAKFDTRTESSPDETLWILNEPYSGMLLTVVTTDTEVVDATLHYNIETDDAGLKRTPFPEHRDPESKTIYVRENCIDALRARCHRLRVTNALRREWVVTPRMSFLTPAEWEAIPEAAGADRGGSAISDLNNARIAELPEGVRSQFHIAVAGDARA